MKKIVLFASSLLALSACQQNEAQVTVEVNKTGESTKVALNKPKTPTLKACTKEARICPDGSSVGRNSRNNCNFDPCLKKTNKPTAKMCTADVKECPDGSYVGRDHYNNCKFKDCPSSELPNKPKE